MNNREEIFNTKSKNLRNFDLNSFSERKCYFEAKAGNEIHNIKNFLENGTFIVFLMAKKGAGKGTYTKLLGEIFGEETIGHISVGDVVRKCSDAMKDQSERIQLTDYLSKNYRGFIPLQEAIDIFDNRSQSKLLPTEFIITLVKREIETQKNRAYFIHGFPRGIDQIPYSLFFKELIDLRNDPDIFVTIDIPELLIKERITSRVVCPNCQSPRNLKFLPTDYVGYDDISGEFFLMCDNESCTKKRMISKDGDKDGIESIRERLNLDAELIQRIKLLHGVKKINLNSTIPVTESPIFCDQYELTKEYQYYKEFDGTIKTTEQNFSFPDDEGVEVNTLLAPAVVVQFLHKLSEVLYE